MRTINRTTSVPSKETGISLTFLDFSPGMNPRGKSEQEICVSSLMCDGSC